MTGRLLVGMPLYTHVSTRWFVNWVQLDKAPMVDLIAIRKLYLAAAMNLMVTDSLTRDGWDRLVVYEADMLPPRDALVRISNYPDTLDIVGCMYFQHPAPHRPVVYTQHDENHFLPLARNQVDDMMAEPGLYPVDAVGMGFTSIHRRVLEKWAADVPMFGGEHELGHDMWFCRAAQQQGFSVHVDTGIECGHLTETPITYESTKQ